MKVTYNITDRKPFVKALEEITGAKAVYMKTPTYAYTVDYFTVTREGNLTFDDMADSEEIERILVELDQRGFHSEGSEYDEPQPEIDCEEPLEDCPPAYGIPETEPQDETAGCGCPVDTSCEARSTDRAGKRDLTVAMPLDKVRTGNLTNLLEAKGSLIKKALGINELPIIIEDEQIAFPWFTERMDADTAKAYTDFIAALCKMSREQKRISSAEKAVENEKYAFRCFLLRLGFVGTEYKTDRKILLKNLTGSSAFKSGTKKEAADDEISE